MSSKQIADKRNNDIDEATLVDDKEDVFLHDPVAQTNSHDSKESNSVKNTASSQASSAKAPLDGGSDGEHQKGCQPRQSSPPISDDDELNDGFPEFPGIPRGKPTTIVASKPKPRPKRVGGQEDGDDEFPEHFPGVPRGKPTIIVASKPKPRP